VRPLHGESPVAVITTTERPWLIQPEGHALGDSLFQLLFGLKVMVTVHDTSLSLPACGSSKPFTLTASSSPHHLHCLTAQKIPKDFSLRTLAA
jgi:hypothetical protein